ncbi:MAG: DNA-binding protein [Lachnospiraceae bacterium]|nr:DNA-binding protein [Lachnospiraceae bacterium]
MEKEKSLTELEEIVELSYLYDFYGALLKENHRLIFEDYVLNDLSLGEIAREWQITRQGVYDIVRRCRLRLKEYEEKLQLVHKFQLTKEKLQRIEKIAGESEDEKSAGAIQKLAEEIYDMI